MDDAALRRYLEQQAIEQHQLGDLLLRLAEDVRSGRLDKAADGFTAVGVHLQNQSGSLHALLAALGKAG